MNLQEVMATMKSKPETFLQNDCIFQLRAFIRGFIFSKNIAAEAICDDHKLLDAVDLQIKELYGIKPGEIISIEEVLDDNEGDKAFDKYIELWHKYVQQ